MSPILFNIVADMLALLINRAKADGKIRGVVPHLVDDGLSILYSLRFGKWSRLEQRHGLQSTTLTSCFYKNIC
jgi:hypothetical protein